MKITVSFFPEERESVREIVDLLKERLRIARIHKPEEQKEGKCRVYINTIH